MKEEWDYNKCIEVSKEFKTAREFSKKYPVVYKKSCQNDWTKDMPWIYQRKKPQGHWTKENVFNEAKKYKTKSEFIKKSPGAYKEAQTKGYLVEMDWFEQLHHDKWTKEEIFEESRKYNSRSEFSDNCYTAYNIARIEGYLDDMIWLKEKEPYWTKERCLEESRKYNSRSEFCKKSKGAYKASRLKGYLDDMTWLKLKNHTKWTKEECYDEALKYNSRSEFGEKSPGAYYASVKNNWIDDYDWLKNPNLKWTKEIVFNEALKYKTSSEFKLNSPGAYHKATSEGWLNDNDMPWLSRRKPIGYWTKETCYNEALKYSSRSEFGKKSPMAYKKSIIEGWIDDYDWFMTPQIYFNIFEKLCGNVYVYEFPELNSAYIGLTKRPKIRDKEHRFGNYVNKKGEIKKSNSAVYKFSIENNVEIPEMKLLETNITLIDAKSLEEHWLNIYKNEGWNILNKAKCGVKSGSLGGVYYKYWTIDKIIEESKKYKRKVDFKKNCPTGYRIACKEKIIDILFPKINQDNNFFENSLW